MDFNCLSPLANSAYVIHQVIPCIENIVPVCPDVVTQTAFLRVCSKFPESSVCENVDGL